MPSSRGDGVGRAGGLALLVAVGGFDRDVLAGEAVLRPGLGGPLLAGKPKASVSSRVMPHLSAMRSAPSNWEVISNCSKYGLGMVHRGLASSLLATDRYPAHHLDTAGQGDVDYAAPSPAWRPGGGLLAAAALGVDSGGGDVHRQTGGEPRGAGDVERLLTDLADAAAHDLAHACRVDAGALDERLLDEAEQGSRGGGWTGRRCACRWACGRLRR